MPFTLPRLPAEGLSGATPEQQQIWWQQVVEAIEAQEALQDEAIAAIQRAQADATAAARESARINSYPKPGEGILGASDAGSDATITIAAHTRVYPVQGAVNVPDVAIAAGQITGLPYSTKLYVFYDDSTLESGAPTFQATTVSADAQVGAADGRHYVGYITTPASGAVATTGGGPAPPGGNAGGTGGAIP